MPSENRARHLQKCIVLCSALGILIVGLVVGATTMMPLYDHLRKVQESHLVLALATKTTAIEEYAARSKDIASRHAAHQQLEDYRNGRISSNQLAEFTRHALFDSVNHFPEVAGVTRLDDKGNPIVQVGLKVPVSAGRMVHTESIETRLHGTVLVENRPYLVAVSPILDNKRKQVGTDLVLIRLTDMGRIAAAKSGLGKSAQTVLAARDNNDVSVILPFADGNNKVLKVEPKGSPVRLAIEKALKGRTGLMIPGKDYQGKKVIAYGPILGVPWAILVSMNKDELYARVFPHMIVTGGTIGVLILLGTFGMVLLVRPLTGKLVIRTDELEHQVHEKMKIIEGLYDEIIQSEKSKVIAEHTAQVAHELRQPLAIIGGYARRMARQMDSGESVGTEQQRESCRTIMSEVRRLEGILDGLIDFTRNGSLRLEKVNPNKIIENVLKVYEDLTKQNSLRLVPTLGKEVGNVLIDPTRFEQVVRNLISNAIESSPPGETIRIETRLLRADDDIQATHELQANAFFEMKIRNRGKMIPPEYIQKIFSPFFTTKESGKGMGLTLSKRIVEDHKGTISVKSDNQETTFTVWIPAQHEDVRENEQPG